MKEFQKKWRLINICKSDTDFVQIYINRNRAKPNTIGICKHFYVGVTSLRWYLVRLQLREKYMEK